MSSFVVKIRPSGDMTMVMYQSVASRNYAAIFIASTGILF